MTVNIRKALPEDQQIYIKFRENLNKFNYNNRPQNERNYNLEERLKRTRKLAKESLEESKENSNMLILIAEVNGKPAGYALAFIFEEGHGLLDHLYVEEDLRGYGVGKELIQKVNGWMKEKKVKNMEIKVFQWNKNAIEFYKNINFKENYISFLRNVE